MECPPPLSGKTGSKAGPCDVSSDDGSVPSYPLTPNAPNTITWLESISHPGAPSRFALSSDAETDGEPIGAESFEGCLLLDHVPHDALSRPNYGDASSWHRSSITLWIPDVYCERCYLQLVSVMSDAQHGVPSDTSCVYQGAADVGGLVDAGLPACPAVYHSCSPVSINGTIPRNDIVTCNTAGFEEKLGWPLTPSRDPKLYERSTYFNRGDVGLYDPTNARLGSIGAPLTDATCTNPLYCDPWTFFETLLEVPEQAFYASPEGSCALVTSLKVEAYQAGGIIPGFTPPEVMVPAFLDDDDASAAAAADTDQNDGSASIGDAAVQELEAESLIGSSGSTSTRSLDPAIYAGTATMLLLTRTILGR